MNQKKYDTLIWGPSLEGIKTAVELKKAGKDVMLAGKFGFPGGKASESLASLFNRSYFEDEGVMAEFLDICRQLKFGILFENQQWILLHPEAVKRAGWQLLNRVQVELLFHVMPLGMISQPAAYTLEVFGREGKIELHAKEIIDMSDDLFLDTLQNKHKGNKTLIINGFFFGTLPPDFPGFHIKRRFETPIGQYFSVAVKNVPPQDIENTFNRELDRLSKESWKKHGVRILMVPVYPEIVEE